MQDPIRREDIALTLMVAALLLFPLAPVVFFIIVFVLSVLMVVIPDRPTMEGYKEEDALDFFPWNEANLVRKRRPVSTVIDCAWSLDQRDDDIFREDDPVVRGYSNLSDQE